MNLPSDTSRAIGVFDSGVGGLTVLRALRQRLPEESFIYLGDTARLPYGTKSSGTVERYALQAASLLISRGIKCLVVACNTASAIAVPLLRQRFAPLPVFGVVEPGAAAGCLATRNERIAIIATEGTIRGGAYQAAIAKLRPNTATMGRACPLFVALAEEALVSGPIVEAIAHRYLDEFFTRDSAAPDTLVLGCTHFPVLTNAIRKVVGSGVAIVDSALTTAEVLERELIRSGQREGKGRATLEFLATDGSERFVRVGEIFLGEPIAADAVELVDLTI